MCKHLFRSGHFQRSFLASFVVVVVLYEQFVICSDSMMLLLFYERWNMDKVMRQTRERTGSKDKGGLEK